MNNSAIYEFKIIKLILSIVNLKKKKKKEFLVNYFPCLVNKK